MEALETGELSEGEFGMRVLLFASRQSVSQDRRGLAGSGDKMAKEAGEFCGPQKSIGWL